jgi:tyrosyl-tRNA synthetase
MRSIEAPGGRIWVARLLQGAGLAPSSSHALRLIREGAVHVNDTRISDPDFHFEYGAASGNEFVVRIGRKRWKRVLLSPGPAGRTEP